MSGRDSDCVGIGWWGFKVIRLLGRHKRFVCGNASALPFMPTLNGGRDCGSKQIQ